jgi:hypothetical protein
VRDSRLAVIGPVYAGPVGEAPEWSEPAFQRPAKVFVKWIAIVVNFRVPTCSTGSKSSKTTVQRLSKREDRKAALWTGHATMGSGHV